MRTPISLCLLHVTVLCENIWKMTCRLGWCWSREANNGTTGDKWMKHQQQMHTNIFYTERIFLVYTVFIVVYFCLLLQNKSSYYLFVHVMAVCYIRHEWKHYLEISCTRSMEQLIRFPWWSWSRMSAIRRVLLPSTKVTEIDLISDPKGVFIGSRNRSN